MENWGLVRQVIDGVAIAIMVGWAVLAPVYFWLTFSTRRGD